MEIISDVLEFSPQSQKHFIIAQLGSFPFKGDKTIRDFKTLLVSPKIISTLKFKEINTLKQKEELTVSWENGNNTHIAPDQSFLKNYRLISRLEGDQIIWDDLSRPQYNVIENKPTSIYSFPNYTEAFVKIEQDYLRDYLLQKKKTAIQRYYEKRIVAIDERISKLLMDKDYYIYECPEFEIRIQRHFSKDSLVHIEVNGYRTLAALQEIKKSLQQNLKPGHRWKGIEKIVNAYTARSAFAFEYAYVSDEVLGKYEASEDYEVYPESGSVYYGNQWSVSHCDRIGRNAIKVELKKMYEGAPDEVIDYWNTFSIDPNTIDPKEINIAELSERILRKYLLFARLFASLVNKVLNEHFTAHEIVSCSESDIEKVGLLQYPIFKGIAHHVSLDKFSREQFIGRCKTLHKVLVEGLPERSFRKIAQQLGFAVENTKSFKSLKLLDIILKYFITAISTGLHPIRNRDEIHVRFDDFKNHNVLSEFFALNDIRQLDAHRSDTSSTSKLQNALEVFDISESNSIKSYARACDQVYDRLDLMFIDINNMLIKAFDHK